ncbi:MAG: histidine kinase [Bacteroidetes bacterium]|nr:histidine kinase [Bacteroidota bacterium]
MKNKFIPYVIICVGSVISALVRWWVIEGWSVWWHSLFLIMQIAGFLLEWEIIKRINAFLDIRMPYSDGSTKRLLVQQGAAIIVALPVFLLFYFMVTTYLKPYFITPQFLAILSVLILVVIFLMNFYFYNEYLSKQWKDSVEEKARLQVTTAQLEKEKSMMQYHHLKNQVNPHFLFNAFTSLDGLIQTNSAVASDYVRHLSKIYRYVLENKGNEIVLIGIELEFIQHYVSLLKIRFNEAVKINLNVSNPAKEKGIVMVTLQMLIDNAVKHNVVHERSPLSIDIYDENDFLRIRNNKQPRKQIDHSTKLGLKQLVQLYSFLTDKAVTITDHEHFFEVKLPLL